MAGRLSIWLYGSDEVQREHGFAIDLRHMAIRGHCARCQPAADGASR